MPQALQPSRRPRANSSRQCRVHALNYFVDQWGLFTVRPAARPNDRGDPIWRCWRGRRASGRQQQEFVWSGRPGSNRRRPAWEPISTRSRKASPGADLPCPARVWRTSASHWISLVFSRFQRGTVTKTVTTAGPDRGVEARKRARLRPAHPTAVNSEQHFERRMPQHCRNVLRRVSMFERKPGERVPALVDDARSNFCPLENARPVASAKVGKVDRGPDFRREN